MKVSMLTLEYPPHIYGGVGVHVYNLTRQLSKFINIEIRTIKIGDSTREFEQVDNVIVKRYKTWTEVIDKTYGKFKPVFNALSLALAINADGFDSDIVHFHTWYMAVAGFYAKKLYGVKLVATVHSLEPKRPWKREALGEGYSLSLWAERTGLESCDLIIAVSHAMKKDLLEVYGIDSGKIEVIHNGIDENVWKPVYDLEILKKYGIKLPYILFVGRLSKQKGIFTLINAFKKLSQKAYLVLVTGKPDDKILLKELQYSIKHLKNVVWINKTLDRNELIPLYTMAEAFVCPSIYEPFGIVNLEALATETPVIASNTGGIPEIIINHKTGILVEPGNSEALRSAIEHILANPEEARKWGKLGRQHVIENFAWSIVAEKTYKAYMKVIGEDC